MKNKCEGCKWYRKCGKTGMMTCCKDCGLSSTLGPCELGEKVDYAAIAAKREK